MADTNNRPLVIVLSVVGVLVLAVCGCLGVVAATGKPKPQPARPAAPAVATSDPVPVAAETTAATTTPAVAITEPAAPPVVVQTTTVPPPPVTTQEPAQDVYYKNCTEAKAAGAAPLYRGEPGYRKALDRDNDGVACE